MKKITFMAILALIMASSVIIETCKAQYRFEPDLRKGSSNDPTRKGTDKPASKQTNDSDKPLAKPEAPETANKPEVNEAEFREYLKKELEKDPRKGELAAKANAIVHIKSHYNKDFIGLVGDPFVRPATLSEEDKKYNKTKMAYCVTCEYNLKSDTDVSRTEISNHIVMITTDYRVLTLHSLQPAMQKRKGEFLIYWAQCCGSLPEAGTSSDPSALLHHLEAIRKCQAQCDSYATSQAMPGSDDWNTIKHECRMKCNKNPGIP